MDVKLEKMLVALNRGDEEHEARLSAKHFEEIDKRKKELELKAEQLSVAQASAEEMLQRQTEEMQHTQKLEKQKLVITSKERDMQILKKTSAERIQALKRDNAVLKKDKDRQYTLKMKHSRVPALEKQIKSLAEGKIKALRKQKSEMNAARAKSLTQHQRDIDSLQQAYAVATETITTLRESMVDKDMALKKRMAEVDELQTRLQRMDELMAQQTQQTTRGTSDDDECPAQRTKGVDEFEIDIFVADQATDDDVFETDI